MSSPLLQRKFAVNNHTLEFSLWFSDKPSMITVTSNTTSASPNSYNLTWDLSDSEASIVLQLAISISKTVSLLWLTFHTISSENILMSTCQFKVDLYLSRSSVLLKLFYAVYQLSTFHYLACRSICEKKRQEQSHYYLCNKRQQQKKQVKHVY